jgi:hypothetical protein
VLVGALVALLVAAGVAAGAAVLTFGERCDLSSLRPVKIGQNSFVYAADGSLLGAIPAERNRQVVPYGRISPWLTRATVAIEDQRFYSHGGVDFIAGTGQISPTLGVPTYVLYLAPAVGFASLSVVYLLRLFSMRDARRTPVKAEWLGGGP